MKTGWCVLMLVLHIGVTGRDACLFFHSGVDIAAHSFLLVRLGRRNGQHSDSKGAFCHIYSAKPPHKALMGALEFHASFPEMTWHPSLEQERW